MRTSPPRLPSAAQIPRIESCTDLDLLGISLDLSRIAQQIDELFA
jgi:hypothetical protein